MLSIIYKRFYNYLEVPAKMPRIILFLLRIASLAAMVQMIILLQNQPSIGNLLIWGVVVPLLPLLIFITPGLWRNICPAAILNQISRRIRIGLKLKLGSYAREWSFVIAMVLFVMIMLINLSSLESQYRYSFMIIGGILAAAFILGFIFEGKAGWCGTFCPMAPLERLWGSTPILNSRNGFCKTCVGCQKNCMDFNPRAAFISDLYDSEIIYRISRTLFVAALPGFLASIFASPLVSGSSSNNLIAYIVLSVGIFHLLRAYMPISNYRLSNTYGLVSFSLFYYYMMPQILSNLLTLERAFNNEYFTQIAPIFSNEYLFYYYMGVGLIVMFGLLISVMHELRFTVSATFPEGFKVNSQSILRGLKEFTDGMVVKEEINDLTFSIFEGQTLLHALESAEFNIESGCRMGLCGSDPVAITDNEDNLSPITPEEMDTLGRLGLLGHARLACMTTVNGSVGISMDCFSNRAKDLKDIQKSNIGWGMLDIPERAKNKDDSLRGKKIVIVGNGVAGMSTAQYLRRLSSGADITVITNEIFGFYNRMGLMKLLENRLYSPSSMMLLPSDWYEQYQVKQMLNKKVSRIDLDKKKLFYGKNESIDYDFVVMALGAKTHMPDIQGVSMDGAFSVRSMEDIVEINNYIQNARVKKITIVGGGWLGIEIAAALKKRNFEVTLVHAFEHLLNKLGNDTASDILLSFLKNQVRLNVICQAGVSRISGQSHVEKIHLTQQDKTIAADMCIFATGVEAQVDFVSKSAIRCGENGIRINRKMQTSEEGIYAVGDCAQMLDNPVGLWGTSMEMGKVAALNIAGQTTDFNVDICSLPRILKISNFDFRTFGKTVAGAEDRMFEHHDMASNKYWSIIVDPNNYMLGGIFINNHAMSQSLYKAMRFRLDVSQLLPSNPSEDELAAKEAADMVIPGLRRR